MTVLIVGCRSVDSSKNLAVTSRATARADGCYRRAVVVDRCVRE
jgi:hypothetical protein